MRYEVKARQAGTATWSTIFKTDDPVEAIEHGLSKAVGFTETIVTEDGIEIPGTFAV